MTGRAVTVGVGVGVVAGIVLGRIFIVRRVRRLLREWHDGTLQMRILAEAAEAFASHERPGPSVRGVVIDAGGGQVGVMVNRDTEAYPPVGTPVTVVETGSPPRR